MNIIKNKIIDKMVTALRIRIRMRIPVNVHNSVRNYGGTFSTAPGSIY